jgi:hypothetical protein
LKWHVNLKSQARVFVTNLSTELQLLLRAQPGLLAGLLALALLTGAAWITQARRLWPLFAVCAAGFALYLPVHVEERFTGGFVIILFLALLATMRLRPADRRSGETIAIAVFAVMILGTADLTVRHATKHFSIPGVGPNSAIEDVAAAEQISRMGAHPGEKIAIIGMGRGVYCARLAKLRIVAEVLAVEHGYEKFWELPDSARSQVYDTSCQSTRAEREYPKPYSISHFFLL